MPTIEQIKARATQLGMSDQEIEATINEGRQSAGQAMPAQQPAPGMGNNQTMQALKAVLGQKRNPWLAGAESFTRSLSKSMGGSPPEAQTDLTDALRKTMGQEQIKQLFQDPLEKRKLQADVAQKEAIAGYLTGKGNIGSITYDQFGNTSIMPQQSAGGLTPEIVRAYEQENPGWTLKEKEISGPGGTKFKSITQERMDRTAAQQEDVDTAGSLQAGYNALANELEDLPSGVLAGNMSKFFGQVTGGQVNTPGELVRQLTPAIAVGSYRFISGDKRVNNEDATQRALPMMPQQGESMQLQDMKTAFFNFMMEKRLKAILSGSQQLELQGSSDALYANLMNEFRAFRKTWEASKQASQETQGTQNIASELSNVRNRISELKAKMGVNQ